MSHRSDILLDDQVAGTVRVYNRPTHVITAWNADELADAFERLAALQKAGFYLAGYVSYETGYLLEPKLSPRLPKDRQTPLLRFGAYKSYHTVSDNLFNPCAVPPALNLEPAWSEAEYLNRFKKVIDYIKAGDVYQINLTFPMKGKYDGTGIDLYSCLRERQPGQFGGVLAFDDFEIVSLSPELFFKTENDLISMRPMKGTAKRLPDPKADQALREAMRHDIKSQAENLMIVDLLRNDLSRIAKKASVKVPELFALETYPTLHQMTSRVQARIDGNLSIAKLFKSLFPCGSVTGAPKIRAMEIIHELEGSPRGPYCGAIGFIDPNGDSCFNVAIRTFTLQGGAITYNVGSGVVLDSVGTDEYAECLLKAAVTQNAPPHLIETLRYDPKEGLVRLDRHMQRLARSAKALNYPFDQSVIENAVAAINADRQKRVRLTLSVQGEFGVELKDYQPPAQSMQLAISDKPLTQEVQETRYKVSDRRFYDSERTRMSEQTGCDEVLFFNARGELCEGSFTSVFVEKDGTLFTPDLSCGLLPGILREEMIEAGQAKEAVLTLENLQEADAIYVGNSLRGLMRAEFDSNPNH